MVTVCICRSVGSTSRTEKSPISFRLMSTVRRSLVSLSFLHCHDTINLAVYDELYFLLTRRWKHFLGKKVKCFPNLYSSLTFSEAAGYFMQSSSY